MICPRTCATAAAEVAPAPLSTGHACRRSAQWRKSLRLSTTATEGSLERLWKHRLCSQKTSGSSCRMIGLAVALTFVVFHWCKFEEGYEKGEAADPEAIARDNPPDEWSKSHWVT